MNDRFVVLTHDTGAKSCEYATVEYSWWTDDIATSDPWIPTGDRLFVRDVSPSKSKRALFDENWKLVVRREVGEELAKLLGDEVRLRDVVLANGKKKIAGEWVFVEIIGWFPMDRDASSATYYGKSPYGALPKRVKKIEWGRDRSPTFGLFRLGEFPTAICARADVAERLVELTAGAIVPASPPYDGGKIGEEIDWEGPVRFYHEDVPPPASLEPSRKAADAFWAALAGDTVDRGVVNADPHSAHWFARLVDEAPADDTRMAACRHPYYAVLQARDVDGSPRDDTRIAAARHRWMAVNYARDVDRAAHRVTKRAAPEDDYEAALDVARALRGLPVSTALRGSQPRATRNASKKHEGVAEVPVRKGIVSRPLDDDEREELASAIERGKKLSKKKGSPTNRADSVAAAVDELRGSSKGKSAGVAVDLGAFWGSIVAEQLGWQWRWVEREGVSNYAIVSPSGSHTVFPLLLVRTILLGKHTSSLRLLESLLREGKLPPSRPGEHLPLE